MESEQTAQGENVPLEQRVGPADVWPVPETSKPKNLVPGPWMPAKQKPTREGKYLRQFDDFSDDDGRAFSWWRNGRWYTQSFFDVESDAQFAPWRGGVRPNAN